MPTWLCSVHEIEQYLAALNIDGLVETSPGGLKLPLAGSASARQRCVCSHGHRRHIPLALYHSHRTGVQ